MKISGVKLTEASGFGRAELKTRNDLEARTLKSRLQVQVQVDPLSH